MSKFRNKNLRDSLASVQPNPKAVEANKIPKPTVQNRQGHAAYAVDSWLKLLTMLNTLKLENQFYRSETETMKELKVLVDECASQDPYLVAQCIVYSRCVGEGMRSVNHLAASYLAPHCGGLEWAKRFYSLWNKKTKSGGTVFRADDMAEIIACFSALNKTKATNAMKKGFAEAIQKMDAYTILKYKSALIDVINLVHPNPKKSTATVEHDGKQVNVIDAVIKGLPVSADTWEVAQSDAGQEVAKAVKEGKIDDAQAKTILKEAKAENWHALLTEGKLGILAALRNIRSMMNTVTNDATLKSLCALLSNGEAIRAGKIMPYQLDLANEVLTTEFKNAEARTISAALLKGYSAAVPNLAEMLPGRNLVMIDFSGSMTTQVVDPNRKTKYSSSCADKAALICATVAKATNADVIAFGSAAEYVHWNINSDVFSIARSLKRSLGGTNLQAAWDMAQKSGKKYDRVFILSDNECNAGNSYRAYMTYVKSVGSPYVYSVDMAAYGTTQLAGDNVRYYYGYGYSMFDDIAKSEFNPNYHLDKVKKIVI
jgi:hypothetical protein